MIPRKHQGHPPEQRAGDLSKDLRQAERDRRKGDVQVMPGWVLKDVKGTCGPRPTGQSVMLVLTLTTELCVQRDSQQRSWASSRQLSHKSVESNL